MSHRALLFSPDGETASNFRVALSDLGLDAVHSRDIFGALEQVTQFAFEVIVVDWDQDPEAGFLLKSAFELRPAELPFSVAIVPTGKEPEAIGSGASLVIHQQAQRDDIKYALLGCDTFLQRMNGWQEQEAAVEESKTAVPSRPVWTVEKREQPARALNDVPVLPIADSVQPATPEIRLPVVISETRMLQRAEVATEQSRASNATNPRALSNLRRFIAGSSIAAMLLAGAGFSYRERRILERQKTDLAIALSSHQAISSVYDQAARTVVHYLPEHPKDEPPLSESAPVPYVKPAPLHISGEIKVEPVAVPDADTSSRPAFTEDALNDDTVKRPMLVPGAASRDVVPDSLRAPAPEASSARNGQGAGKQAGGVEPVNLPETQADEMLVEKDPPAYPQQALDSGVEGPVVFQAWIARDGSIRDLKLIRGPMMLGQAAYNTVKKWRYRPYSVNGEVMEAKTLVTVNFSRP
jgi:TonB family protein